MKFELRSKFYIPEVCSSSIYYFLVCKSITRVNMNGTLQKGGCTDKFVCLSSPKWRRKKRIFQWLSHHSLTNSFPTVCLIQALEKNNVLVTEPLFTEKSVFIRKVNFSGTKPLFTENKIVFHSRNTNFEETQFLAASIPIMERSCSFSHVKYS